MPTTLEVSRECDFSIRPLEDLQDFEQAEQVQREAWDFSDRDIVPASIFSVARRFGGQAIGAFDGKRLVAFGLCFGAVHEGHAHLHSHMVGVVPAYHNQGLGRRIKLAQRDDAIHRGIDRIEWTFDPLQRRNAYFNLERLGGVGVRYLPNLYGVSSSPLHGGIPTDRLVIEWNLKSDRVESILGGATPGRGSDAITIEIPPASMDLSKEIRLAGQEKLRSELTELLKSGYAVVGFEGSGGDAHYILEPYASGA